MGKAFTNLETGIFTKEVGKKESDMVKVSFVVPMAPSTMGPGLTARRMVKELFR